MIAVFQVLIYVGAVMVFMVYVIMLLDVRDRSFTRRFSRLLVPGIAGCVAVPRDRSRTASGRRCPARRRAGGRPSACSLSRSTFLNEYWLHFELVSVLLVAAVVAALAVLEVGRRRPWITCRCSIATSRGALRAGAARRHRPAQRARHADVHGADAERRQPEPRDVRAADGDRAAGAVLVFLVFVVAAAEIAIAIPIVLLLARRKRALDLDAYADLKG